MPFTITLGDSVLCESEYKGGLSDGYHTFDELYAHRVALFIALCKQVTGEKMISGRAAPRKVWRSLHHSDGSHYDGWFLLGIGTEPGKQITYHLPLTRWTDCAFAEDLPKAPEFDGHTSADVLERLKGI
jgi:hypothetical protein